MCNNVFHYSLLPYYCYILFVVVFYCFSNTFAKVQHFSDITKLIVLNAVKKIILFIVKLDLFLFSNINII